MAFRQRVTGPSADTLMVRFLVVQVQDATLAVWADSVRGVLTAEDVGAKHDIMLLGETYRMTGLARRLGLAQEQLTAHTRFVLCHRGQGRCMIAVDRVLGLTDIRRDAIQPLSPLFSGEERVWLRGLFLYDEGMAAVVNPDWMVHDPESAAIPAAVR